LKSNPKKLYVEINSAKGKQGYYGNSYNEYYNVQKESYNDNINY